MKKPSYGERRRRPIRWWEIASCNDPSRMPFLRHFPEPPAVLVAQILGEARGLIAAAEAPSRAAAPPAADPWDDDGLCGAWFASGDPKGDRPSTQAQATPTGPTDPADHQGGLHA